MRLVYTLLIILNISIAFVYAQIPQPINPSECPDYSISNQVNQCDIERNESTKELKFVNAYFGFKGSKLEVAPNDGIRNLIVVLANNGQLTLSGLRAWLTLPTGFVSIDNTQQAFATYDLAINPGDTIYLEFPVKITNVRIGTYYANLYVEYFRVRQQGIESRNMLIPFMVTGKSVLNVYSNVSKLDIGTNSISISILNNGSAPAYGLTATLSSDTLGIVGEKQVILNTVEPNSNATINAKIYAPPYLANTIQRLKVDLEYYDSYGMKNSKSVELEYMVEGSTSKVNLTIDLDKNIVEVLKNETLLLRIKNEGYEDARNVEVLVKNPLDGKLSIVGDGYYFIDRINAGDEKVIRLKLFSPESSSTSLSRLPIQITYLDKEGGKYEISRELGVYLKGPINIIIYGVGISMVGNKPTLSGFLLNEGTETALFTRIELLNNNSSQYIGDLNPNSPTPFSLDINGTLKEASIKVTYKDSLRRDHELTMKIPINYTPTQTNIKAETRGFLESSNVYIISIIGITSAGVAIVSIYIVRKRRHRNT